jgi:glycosyltransferase involved in cell wall biosynthesis
MAAKNYARFLPEAVESVLAQSFADWELLIIDDGSTDATPAAARPFLADDRVRYFRADKLGQPRAKNLGIGLSRGEFVAFLDADDAWEPTKLKKQLAIFRDNPGVGVVFCRRSLIDEKGTPIAARQAPPPPRGRVLPAMFVQNFVCFSSAVVRREVFAHVGRFDPQWDLAIDFDLWLRVARHHGFDFVDEELDHGAIIVQKAIPVLDTDDEHTLAARILEQEHVAYSEAINIVLAGGYEIVGRRLVTSVIAR